MIDEVDCCTKNGLCVSPIIDLEFIKHRLIGRFLLRDILLKWNGNGKKG